MRVVAMILLLCFLPYLSIGQNRSKSSSTSYVAETKKKKSCRKKDKISYLDHAKKSQKKVKDSYLKNHKKSKKPTGSYLQSQSAPKFKVSYLAAHKLPSKKPSVNLPVVSKRLEGQRPRSNKVTATRSVRKVKSKKIKSNFTLDPLAFNLAAEWAEAEGKTSLARKVVKKYGSIIKGCAREFNVDYRIIIAICTHESSGNPWIVSSAGACGLMQLMPITAGEYGVTGDDIFDPYQNLRAGTHYYSDLVKTFGNQLDAIYAYGTGQYKAQKRFSQGIKSQNSKGVQRVAYLASLQ